MALLGLLHLLAPREHLQLSVGHVDHALRPESADEAALVAALARTMDLPLSCTRLELSRGPGLPARARDARHQALHAQAAEHGASLVALGHTATDQAETVLLHLTRGAGLDGLAAMSELDPWIGSVGEPTREGYWLRPLLDLDRAEARALAGHLQLPFVDDPTNDDLRHPRVRVRHEVLQVLRQLNPRVEHALARTAMHARQAEEALDAWVHAEMLARRRGPPISPEIDESSAAMDDPQAHAIAASPAAAVVTCGPRWSTESMKQLPVAVRTRIVRQICRAAGAPDDALSSGTLASIDQALVRPGPARAWDLHPGLRLHLAAGELWIDPERSLRPLGPATGAANH